MLERAAAAAGYVLSGHTQSDQKVCVGGKEWNPRDDDGDAFRLAVKLGLDFYEGDDDGKAAYVGYYPPSGGTRPQRFKVERHEDHPDKYAATRLAIVRAAAATLPEVG